MASGGLRVALCQMLVSKVKSENIAKAALMIERAKAGGASLVILPECFNCPYGTKYFAEYAEPIDRDASLSSVAAAAVNAATPCAPTVDAMREAARAAGVWLVAGTIPERDERSGRMYNSSMVIDPSGAIRAVQRKLHLFKIDTPQLRFDESEVLGAGSEANAVCILDGSIKIGVGVCFDVRFPQLALHFRDQGTSLLVFPSAFNMVTGPVHWALSAQARALDAQQFVLMCSPARDTTADYVAYGHSIAVDPFGKILVEADEGEGLHFVDLGAEAGGAAAAVADARRKLPITAGTRSDLYELVWKDKSN